MKKVLFVVLVSSAVNTVHSIETSAGLTVYELSMPSSDLTKLRTARKAIGITSGAGKAKALCPNALSIRKIKTKIPSIR